MKFVLLVTLLMPGQPPHSYQVEISSRLHCSLAKTAVEKEYAEAFSKLNLTYSVICIEKMF
jgi:hypothetical protein